MIHFPFGLFSLSFSTIFKKLIFYIFLTNNKVVVTYFKPNSIYFKIIYSFLQKNLIWKEFQSMLLKKWTRLSKTHIVQNSWFVNIRAGSFHEKYFFKIRKTYKHLNNFAMSWFSPVFNVVSTSCRSKSAIYLELNLVNCI